MLTLLFFIFLLLCLTVAVCASFLHIQHSKYSHVPGPPRESFWLGHLELVKRLHAKGGGIAHLVHTLSLEYGHTFVLWFYNRPVLCTLDPSSVKELLLTSSVGKSKDAYSRLSSVYGQRLLGQGLVTETDHSVWRERRGALNHAFTARLFPGWIQLFSRHADKLVQQLSIKADGSTELCLLDVLQTVTIDIIAQIAFGLDTSSREGLSPYHIAVKQVILGLSTAISDPVNRVLPWRQNKFKQAVRDCCIFLRQTGHHLVDNRRTTNANADDVLSCLMKSCDDLDDNEQVEVILDDFVTFLIAGQETTSSLVSFVLMELGRNPDVLQRLLIELDSLPEDTLTLSELTTLHFTDLVVKETLRLYPSVPSIFRILSKTDIIGGYNIPGQTEVLLSSYASGRFPDYFVNSDQFDPDRHEINAKDRKPGCTMFPFSLGPRNCIGQMFAQMETKVLLVKILRAFNLHLSSDQSFGVTESTTLRPTDGVKCTLTCRHRVIP